MEIQFLWGEGIEAQYKNMRYQIIETLFGILAKRYLQLDQSIIPTLL